MFFERFFLHLFPKLTFFHEAPQTGTRPLEPLSLGFQQNEGWIPENHQRRPKTLARTKSLDRLAGPIGAVVGKHLTIYMVDSLDTQSVA